MTKVCQAKYRLTSKILLLMLPNMKRQAEMEIRRLKAGMCAKCGKRKRRPGRRHCEECAVKVSNAALARYYEKKASV